MQNVNKYMDAGVVVQNRKKYFYLLEELQKWIVKSENILNTPQTNTNEEIMNYCRQLQVTKKNFLIFFFCSKIENSVLTLLYFRNRLYKMKWSIKRNL